jgi:hypothetical protein
MYVLYSENTIKKQHPSNVIVLKRVSFDITNFPSTTITRNTVH